MLKSVFAPHLGRHVKMGRTRPDPTAPRLKLSDYLDRKALPTPPASLDYTPLAMQAVSNMYMNDQLGDCVIAGGYHVRGITSANAGGPIALFSNAQVVQDYSAIGGYVPGNPSTDQGCDEVTALNYWMNTGFPDGVKLAGWLTIDATNETEIMQAIWLFENNFYGMELPDDWVQNMPSASGFTWDVEGAPDPSNGHCVAGGGYTKTGVKICTWALTGTITWAATAEYASSKNGGELHILLSPDMLIKAQQKSPAGVDWPSLIADFDAMGGTVPAPNGPPVTPPTPVNPPAPAPEIFSLRIPTAVAVGQEVEFTAPVAIPPGKYKVVPVTVGDRIKVAAGLWCC